MDHRTALRWAVTFDTAIEEGPGRGAARPVSSSLYQNVAAHSSTAIAPPSYCSMCTIIASALERVKRLASALGTDRRSMQYIRRPELIGSAGCCNSLNISSRLRELSTGAQRPVGKSTPAINHQIAKSLVYSTIGHIPRTNLYLAAPTIVCLCQTL